MTDTAKERLYTASDLRALNISSEKIRKLKSAGVITPTIEVRRGGQPRHWYTQRDVDVLNRELLRGKQANRRRFKTFMTAINTSGANQQQSRAMCSKCGKVALYMLPRRHEAAIPRCLDHKGSL